MEDTAAESAKKMPAGNQQVPAHSLPPQKLIPMHHLSEPVHRTISDPIRPLRVLLVEDHEITLKLLSRLMRACGHDVSAASTFSAALKLAAERSFELLIADIVLPDGSGWDLPARISALKPAAPPIPAIALSGYGGEEEIRQSLGAGFAEHLLKPVEIRKLHAAIARLVNV